MSALAAIHHGVVVDNQDPESLWRVRVVIPGVIEPYSNWAYPLGTFGGGSHQKGGWRVPDIGADVGVLFIEGDPERPVYLPGWWGVRKTTGTEIPSPVSGLAKADAPKVAVLVETARYIAYTDDRGGKEALVLKDKVSGDLFEMDGTGPGITIQATAAIQIKCDGLISIEGSQIQLNGRLVVASKKPI